MEISINQLETVKANGTPLSEIVLIPTDGVIWPEYKGKLRIMDENEKDRQSILRHALNTFGFLMPNYTAWRISFLGEQIKKYTTDEKAHFIADMCLVNGQYLSPFVKHPTGRINQI